LIIVPSGSARKNRKAEATANGEAGATNQYGRYLGERKTLNETSIPQEDDPPAETPALRAAEPKTLEDAQAIRSGFLKLIQILREMTSGPE
jgi:hypothetical protein